MAPAKSRSKRTSSSSSSSKVAAAARKKSSKSRKAVTSLKQKHAQDSAKASNKNAQASAKASTESVSHDCGVCLEPIKIRGKIDCCEHMFCYKCIKKWMGSSNVCPLCKARVSSLTKVIKGKNTGKGEKIKRKDFGDTLRQESFNGFRSLLQRFMVRHQGPDDARSYSDHRNLILDMMIRAIGGRGSTSGSAAISLGSLVFGSMHLTDDDNDSDYSPADFSVSPMMPVTIRGGGTAHDPITFDDSSSDDGVATAAPVRAVTRRPARRRRTTARMRTTTTSSSSSGRQSGESAGARRRFAAPLAVPRNTWSRRSSSPAKKRARKK